MSTISCTTHEYGEYVLDFLKQLPNAKTVRQVERMQSIPNLAYLGVTDMYESKLNEIKAVQYFDLVSSKALERMREIISEDIG